jgi:regulatory protein
MSLLGTIDHVADAYETGLRMLARRELSEAQLRLRLQRRQLDPDDIDRGVERLRREGALDDRRTALACARTEAQVKRHGRRRVLRQLQALGIDRGIATAAVTEVFADVDESSLLAQAIERRLRGASLDRSTLQRVQRYLLSKGFEAGPVNEALRSRMKNVAHED